MSLILSKKFEPSLFYHLELWISWSQWGRPPRRWNSIDAKLDHFREQNPRIVFGFRALREIKTRSRSFLGLVFLKTCMWR